MSTFRFLGIKPSPCHSNPPMQLVPLLSSAMAHHHGVQQDQPERKSMDYTNELWDMCIYIYILVGGFNPAEKYESQLG